MNQHELASFVCTHWAALQSAAALSSFPMSRPKAIPGKTRAIESEHPFSEWPLARAHSRAGKRFLLCADISLFYASIYTHSVPWALHTKAVAKANKTTSSLIGNKLDLLLRNSNDQQTIGLPIGPDVSFLIAEIILASVDRIVGPTRLAAGTRYLDDYEFSFATLSEAEQALADLQGAVSHFELALNPRKCTLEELPRQLEATWVADLRHFKVAASGKSQVGDLISFFTRSFVAARQFPQDSVLRYAVGRTTAVPVEPKTFPVYQDLLLQTASAEPGALPGVIRELAKYSAKGFAVDKDAVSSVLSGICKVHAPTAHGSEVAWAIWGAIALDAGLDPTAEKPISQMTDSVVALLAMDAQKRGLISPSLDVSLWNLVVSAPAELLGPQWLLAYEASVKSWLPSSSLATLSSANPYFSNLASAGVSFYDGGIIPKPTSVASPTPPAGSSAGSSPSDDSGSEDFEDELGESEGWQDY